MENETQKTGGYDVTFLGTVTGNNLIPAIRNTQDAGNIQKDLTYVVIAIQKSDGTSMPSTMDPEYKTFCVSPLVHGKNFMELNNGTIDAGVYSFVQDGVQYELLECKNLKPYAKDGVSIGVVERFGEEPEAFNYDASTGVHSRNENYQKINALFECPFQ